jgi:hypothetical protein
VTACASSEPGETGVVVLVSAGSSGMRPGRAIVPALCSLLIALVSGPGVASGATVSEAPLGWGPIPAGSTGGSETFADAVTCPSTSQCTVVDNQGQAVTFDPVEPGRLSATTVDLDDALAGVACPSQSQCAAVDNEGKEVTFDPLAPTAGPVTSLGVDSLQSVACPSSTECIAVGDPGPNVVAFDPLAPQDLRTMGFDSSNGLVAVACPSATQCTAVDLIGNEVTFDPLAPSYPTPAAIDASNWLKGLACPSADQCTAVDDAGREVTFDPTAPGAPTPAEIAPGEWLWGVACPSSTQCTALGEHDEVSDAVTFDPSEPDSAETAPLGIDAFAGALSCPSVSQCTAVGGAEEVTFDPELPGSEPTSPPIVEAERPTEGKRPAEELPGRSDRGCGAPAGCTGADGVASVLTVGDQSVTLQAQPVAMCVAAGARLRVSLSSASVAEAGAERLLFRAAAVYLDKGLVRTRHEIRRTAAGRGTSVPVTSYVANVTTHVLPVTVDPLVTGLAPGAHTLTVKLYFEQTRAHGRHRALTILRTLHTTFDVC